MAKWATGHLERCAGAAGRASLIGLAVVTATWLSTAIPAHAAGECASGMQSGCRAAGKATLFIKNPSGSGKLVWKWLKGEATVVGDFGAPTLSTDFALCIYAGTVAIIEAEVAASGTLWTTSGPSGFKYKDSAGGSDGVRKVFLRAGADGKAKALLKGKGANLPVPPAGPFTLPVTAQLVNSANGVCFEGVYDGADVIKNEAEQFKAKASISCGDNTVEGNEQCDGSADAACPGQCLSNCTCRVPCGSSAPACSGGCPPGQSCAGCTCGPAIPTECGDTFPVCNGACPTGESCAANPAGGNCGCVPIDAVPCANSLGSMCGGACPVGTACQQAAGPLCVCL